MHYSAKSTQGFYDTNINSKMPDDAVELPEGLHEKLLKGRGQGKLICWDAELPYLQDRPEPTLEQLNNTVNINRRIAYASESDPLFFEFQRGDANKQEWLDMIEEIKERYPKFRSPDLET